MSESSILNGTLRSPLWLSNRFHGGFLHRCLIIFWHFTVWIVCYHLIHVLVLIVVRLDPGGRLHGVIVVVAHLISRVLGALAEVDLSCGHLKFECYIVVAEGLA